LLQQWKSMDQDDLASGLTPFLLAPWAAQECKAQQKLVDIASIVYSGVAALLADVAHLLADKGMRSPLDWGQAKTMLYFFTVLFHGLLGLGHHLVVALGDLMDWFKKFKPYLGQLQPPTMVHHLNLPTLAVWWVQVRVAKWLKDQHQHRVHSKS